MSNSLPPPPPRRRPDGARQGSSLSNADFRRMVIDTPRRAPEPTPSRDSASKKREETPRRAQKKYRPKPKVEDKKLEEDDAPKYRDRAKERREDQNPDYEPIATGVGSLHAVPPPSAIDLHAVDAQKIAIEKSKYLGGDVEHTHLVKGLDYALLNKVRSEIEKAPEEPQEPEEKPAPQKSWNEEEPLVFHSAAAKVVHRWLVKPQNVSKVNEMFLPGRMAFVFDMEDMANHIPTTLYRSKADCPHPEEYVRVGVDGPVLDRISKIMAYLKLGNSGKGLKKRKKDKSEAKAKIDAILEPKVEAAAEEDQQDGLEQENDQKPRNPEDDIFEGVGVEYVPPVPNAERSPHSEDMEESPREGHSYFQEPWQQTELGPVQGPSMPTPGDWQGGYPPPGTWPQEEYAYPEPYYNAEGPSSAPPTADAAKNDPRVMTQEEKDRGLGSVFKRDDRTLQQRREKDAREKDPNFVSESYSECYPGYQEYNREIVDSDEEEDLTKMDVGAKAKGKPHKRDFGSEEEWTKHNDRKEATPKAAFQFGVKTQDGRKTRKNREQKLNNELNKINQILERKKAAAAAGEVDEVIPGSKKARN